MRPAMQTLSEIRELLAARGLRPKHRLGQNFLHDKNQLTKLIDAAGVAPGDLILEVGPGTGTLTEALIGRGAEVIACELDADMASIVEERFKTPALTLIRGDCLAKGRQLNKQVSQAIGNRPFKLVANLPYQAASPLMSTLLIDHPNCLGQFVTIQKEVADRLLAEPSTKAYGPLTIIIQAMAAVERLAVLSPGCFWPPPEVTSAMVAIVPRPREASAFRDEIDPRSAARDFARFITELFSKRRKQLGAILGRGRATWPQGVSADLRPEALGVAQLLELWRMVRTASPT
jgi:16S rRNA (adenine1518-N6/adenine1519-N6)-dimethyltransferase